MEPIEKTRYESIKKKKSSTQLLFDDKGEWYPLPNWGNFFLELGHYIAKYEDEDNCLVLALALPSRSYAAALTALGIVQIKASCAEIDGKKRFQELCKLPEETPVYYDDNGKKLKAILEGAVQNRKQLKVRLQSKDPSKKHGGSLTHYIDETKAFKITTVEEPFYKLPKNQKGRTIKSQHNSLLSSLIGTQKAEKYSTISRLECILVGSKSILKQEITQSNLCISEQSGFLQDILQVRSFKTSKVQAYHSDVFSEKMSKSSKNLDDSSEIVIFDGAKSFLNCRDNYDSSHWIILLDRTEIHFQEAVDIVNQDYYDRLDDLEIDNLDIPFGVELMAYISSKIIQ